MIYLLYSPRSGGWLTSSSNYSSDYREAKTFDRDDALAMCKRHKDRAGYGMIPVRQEDLLAL
jgi:hypothetical protein